MRVLATTVFACCAVLVSAGCGSSKHAAAAAGQTTTSTLPTVAAATTQRTTTTRTAPQATATPGSTPSTNPAAPATSTAAKSQVVQQSICPSAQGVGIDANFGHRRTIDTADVLLARAQSAGFQSLVVQQRGCDNFAVVLPGLKSLRVGRALRVEARHAGFTIALECRSHAVEGGLAAVFGHRRTRRAAAALRAHARARGFQGLEVVQDRCNDWEVDLYGIKTRPERRAFSEEARRAGFRVTYEPG